MLASPAHLYMPHLFTHCCLPTIICVMLMSIAFFLFLLYATFLCDSILDCLCTYFYLIGFCASPLFCLCCFHSVVSVSWCWFLQFILIIFIAFRILVLSIRFIVPSVVQCYLVHWLNILSIAWLMMRESTEWFRVQHSNIAWNLWGQLTRKKNYTKLGN